MTDSLFQISGYPYVFYLSVPDFSTFYIFPDYREHHYTEPAKPVFETKHFAGSGMCKAVLGIYKAFFLAWFQIKWSLSGT